MSTQYINEPITSGKVTLETTAGDIEIELWTKEAPLACRNFIQLCMENYYKGCVFHRLVKNFILQGGDPTGTGRGGESIWGKPFKDEFHQRLKFNRRGIVGMANAGKDDNGSQFFFTIGDRGAPELNNKHTVFGKVTGPTLFNMLKITEVETEKSTDRPVTMYKITGARIQNNPFDDILPRDLGNLMKKEKKEKKEKNSGGTGTTKKMGLLSFGDEAEEDEEELSTFNKKTAAKPKSAHDALNDERLSKTAAVSKNEMSNYVAEDDDYERDSSSVSKIREKLMKRKRKLEESSGSDKKEQEEEQDLEEMIENEKKAKEKEEISKMSEELTKMQKEYMKALRPVKEKKKKAKNEEISQALKDYADLKESFKSKTSGLVKKKDSRREQQTMQMLDRFKKRLGASNQEAILHDKKVEISKKEEELEEEKKFGLDLDAEDMAGISWMAHKFKAEDQDLSSKAKDANLREEDEDWYSITDPRNRLNRRKRGELD
ncbi:unnamed protein product [Caenorhabditis angaria]|uniref:Spliceosome-associated protein CWC27 homolog n=1 Tax=Caenorhabditis angaria TaxID=860376 RepID=A0A9P1IFY6_9PELO|nr:unnamed protein product [Caenorhabditis angaria]